MRDSSGFQSGVTLTYAEELTWMLVHITLTLVRAGGGVWCPPYAFVLNGPRIAWQIAL